MENNGLRIQKYLSDCGIMSRRKAEEEIRDGKIFVNGKVAEIGQKINPTDDVVMYHGKVIEKTDEKYYLMLNSLAAMCQLCLMIRTDAVLQTL